MPLHLIIDGYNFIRQSDELRALERQALEFGRDALIEKLAAYRQIKRHKITIVFDGSQKYIFPDAQSSWKGVAIKFSRQGETADGLIRKMARQEGEKAVVVSSDKEIIRFADAHGAATLESVAFEEKLQMAEMAASGIAGEPDSGGGTRRANGTRKKGPARKLPKSQRRMLKKTGKL